MEKTVRLPNFEKENIGLIVGPSSKACDEKKHLRNLPSLRKNVISRVWSSYNLHKSENKITEDDPKTPYIQLLHDDGGVYAVVKSDSECMLKFALFHLDEYHREFKVPKKKMVYTAYVAMNHQSIPRLIGRGASTIKAIRTEAVSQMNEDTDAEDLAEAEKSFIKVDKFTPRDFEDFKNMVETSTRSSFVGWAGGDQEEELVKVYISSYLSGEAFDEFIECLIDVLDNHVREINEASTRFERSREAELERVQAALNKEW
tara:strand:+ start:266 stop:1042 length:777 start_codon:yes stop_codon:yes gene_type:complete